MEDETGYVLAALFMGIGTLTARDLKNYSDATGEPVVASAWTITATLAGWGVGLWIIYGFFIVRWWVPIAAFVVPCFMSVFEPNRLRFASWRPLYGTVMCCIGFLNVALFLWTRYR